MGWGELPFRFSHCCSCSELFYYCTLLFCPPLLLSALLKQYIIFTYLHGCMYIYGVLKTRAALVNSPPFMLENEPWKPLLLVLFAFEMGALSALVDELGK